MSSLVRIWNLYRPYHWVDLTGSYCSWAVKGLGLTLANPWALRKAIELLLCFTFSSSIVERTLKEVPLQERAQRAHMLGTTMENLLLAQQAPQGEQLAKCVNGTIEPLGPYLPAVIRLYMQRFGAKPAGRKFRVKPRRDTGSSKDPEDLAARRLARGAPEPEADSLFRELKDFACFCFNICFERWLVGMRLFAIFHGRPP